MATSNLLTKMMGSVLQSSAKSLISGGIKKGVKGLIKQHMQKTPQQIEKEIVASLGYLTSHYKLDKEQNIIYRPSSVFMLEWLNNAPIMKGKLVKDEEDGVVYYNGSPITNQNKVAIIHQFMKDTQIQSPSLSSHFDAATKLFDVSNIVGDKFKTYHQGWQEGSPSVIDGFLEGCFGSALETDPTLAKMMFRKWIIGTSRRAINERAVLDGCLTLKGPSDVGKSSFFRNLLEPSFNTRVGEIYCDVRNQNKVVESIVGRSIVAFDELSVLDYPNTLEVFKQLLTTQTLTTRRAWRRTVETFPLRCGFAGSTNRDNFIADPALSRRLWVIKLNGSKRLDFDFLANKRKALWQEGVWLAEHDATCIMSPEERRMVEEHNRQFMVA